MTALQRRFAVAQAACAEAGALALSMLPLPGASAGTLKGAQDWLTEADGAVERFLSDRMAAEFPQDGFQGEEAGAARGGALRWVVDPIDGTSNFARGATRWCVSLGCWTTASRCSACWSPRRWMRRTPPAAGAGPR